MVVLKFRVFGDMRFLSHSETMRVFHRACVRADIDMAFSSGFNPRPRISLSLPRSVALAAEDEICCIRLNEQIDQTAGQSIQARLNEQLPNGIEIITAQPGQSGDSFVSGSAEYELIISASNVDAVKAKAKEVLESTSLKIQRQVDARGRVKEVDVRKYLKTIEFDGSTVTVTAEFSSGGAVRVGEILTLLGLSIYDLEGPVVRKKVVWD